MIGIFGGLGLSFGIKLEGGVRGKNIFKHKVGLLVRELIRKIYRLRKRYINWILSGKKLKKKFGVVLEKCFFDILCGCR
jgi:hypothetical protein